MPQEGGTESGTADPLAAFVGSLTADQRARLLDLLAGSVAPPAFRVDDQMNHEQTKEGEG